MTTQRCLPGTFLHYEEAINKKNVSLVSALGALFHAQGYSSWCKDATKRLGSSPQSFMTTLPTFYLICRQTTLHVVNKTVLLDGAHSVKRSSTDHIWCGMDFFSYYRIAETLDCIHITFIFCYMTTQRCLPSTFCIKKRPSIRKMGPWFLHKVRCFMLKAIPHGVRMRQNILALRRSHL